MIAPLPADEIRRQATLRSYDVLDTPPEQAFDDLVLLARTICQTPIALVSLIDERRQWFKARCGIDVAETSRDVSFCAHAILDPGHVLEVQDALLDPRFVDNPLVNTDPKIRFYAGAPLVAPDGQALGTVCVLDFAPRSLTPAQVAALAAVSRQAVAQLELSRHVRELAVNQRIASEMLDAAEKSRWLLLSVLEDEKLASHSLRESEERFRQVVENIREVFWMTEVKKDVVLYVSPGYALVWGRTCESLYAEPDSWLEGVHEADRARVGAAASAGSGAFDETYRVVRPDGAVRWVHDKAFPVTDAAGNVGRIVGVAEDITERKELEEQFLRAQRMEAIGTLAGGIAHDLNNILAPMLMVAPLLREKRPDARDGELITMIEQGARRGAGIIKQLLTFSRGIGGERGPVQLRHLVKEMTGIMREAFPREITVQERIPAQLWTVNADATQLHQVLMNLCVNSRDAMPAGGLLTVTTENVMLTAADVARHAPAHPGPHVRLTVTDTGEGISRANLERIFDPFFTTKGVGKGTGLGLSTVIGIVRSHGGFLVVESEVGRGSAFKVYLPASPESVEEDRVAATVTAGGAGETILVVEDEEPIRQMLQLILEKNNYHVLVAADGRAAAELFAMHREQVRLVLTDVMMPRMDGLALIRFLRTQAPLLPIVAMTGLHDQIRLDDLAKVGVATVLAKPCGGSDVLEALQRELAARKV